jgi:hypothetical protein
MVVRQEQLIDTELHGNAALKASLRTAYISALRILITKHATTSGQTEEDLYRINSGRVPAWAQVPRKARAMVANDSSHPAGMSHPNRPRWPVSHRWSRQLLDEVQNVTVQIAYPELARSIKRVVDVLDEVDPIRRPCGCGLDLARLEKPV